MIKYSDADQPGETHVHIALNGTYAGTKADLDHAVAEAIRNAERQGAWSRQLFRKSTKQTGQ